MSTTLNESTKLFLVSQIDRLRPFDFVLFSPGDPAPTVEVGRDDVEGFRVCVPTNSTTPVPLTRRARLAEAGWRSADPTDPAVPWEHGAVDSADALALAAAALSIGWDSGLGDDLDVVHGNRRAEHEAALALSALRSKIEPLLAEVVGFKPDVDDDGDYRCPLDGLPLTVSIRATPGAPVLVRVFSATNIGVTIGPEIGLFLSRLNLGMTFGRFVLDTDHQAVWFEETLLGATISDDELRFMLDWVARSTAEWGPRLQHMFGGVTQQELDASRLENIKPQTWRRGR